MSSEIQDAELAALAKALAALAPAGGRLDRDQLLFRAGQVSFRRRAWLWPSVAAVLALLSGAMGLSEVLRPAPQRVECVVYRRVEPALSPANLWANQQSVQPDAATPAAEQLERQDEPLSYLHLQRFVLAWGVDAFPNPIADDSPVRHGPVLSALLPQPSRDHWLGMPNP